MVFYRPRSTNSILAWLLTLIFLPGIGFLLYAFLGRGLSNRKTIFHLTPKEEENLEIIKNLGKIDSSDVHKNERIDSLDIELLTRFFNSYEYAPITYKNETELFTDGKAKFEAVFNDIRNAKESVHVEYYQFFNDRIGNRFLRLLEEKAAEGLEVRLIYDPWGSPKANKKWFKKFVSLGGEVTSFVTSRNLILKTRLNYHLHRKIVVCDGTVGWTGGFNVGDQYLGENPKFGYWRDSHIRIVGSGVLSLQAIFIRDWNASVTQTSERLDYDLKYFPLPSESITNNCNLQIISDGPDSITDILKGGMIRMILSAKKTVWIQTPYLIPDDAILEACLIAINSGIDVRFMIPCMPDHPFIYRATQYYANQLHKAGARIFIYDNGFIHAKTIVVDNEICSIGSMNQDIRSYSLNFEANVFIYNEKVSNQFTEIFLDDMKLSHELTDEEIKNQSHWLHFKQSFSRLLSPIL